MNRGDTRTCHDPNNVWLIGSDHSSSRALRNDEHSQSSDRHKSCHFVRAAALVMGVRFQLAAVRPSSYFLHRCKPHLEQRAASRHTLVTMRHSLLPRRSSSSTLGQTVFILLLSVLTFLCRSSCVLAVEHPVAPADCSLPAASRAGCYGQEWTAVPTNVPSGSGTDGPLAGNGDFGVVLSGGSGTITLFTGE